MKEAPLETHSKGACFCVVRALLLNIEHIRKACDLKYLKHHFGRLADNKLAFVCNH